MNVDKIVSFLFKQEGSVAPSGLRAYSNDAATAQAAAPQNSEAVKVTTSSALTKTEPAPNSDKLERIKAQVASGDYRAPTDLAAKVYAELF